MQAILHLQLLRSYSVLLLPCPLRCPASSPAHHPPVSNPRPTLALPTPYPQGGKSVYTRQVALIVILAQIGSFVPAASARLSVFDAVLTRMGASDSLALGTSTFLEEMSETGAILRTATERSLVVLDELGRGTSTQDGQAIAAAVLEHLVSETRALTLFVTHFPAIARALEGSVPVHVACTFSSFVQEEPQTPAAAAAAGAGGSAATGGRGAGLASAAAAAAEAAAAEADAGAPRISFLFRQVPGISPRSFGLNVARMAGVAPRIVAAAADKAAEVERHATAGAATAASGCCASAEVAASGAGDEEMVEGEEVEEEDDAALGERLREALRAVEAATISAAAAAAAPTAAASP